MTYVKISKILTEKKLQHILEKASITRLLRKLEKLGMGA